MDPTSTDTGPKAEKTVSLPALMAVVAPAMLLMVIASDMANLVLPLMGEEFGASEARLAWVVTGFLLVFAIGIPIYGRVSDRVGMRRLFCAALLVYALGSLVSALAPSLLVLVLGRIVMGADAAAIPVLSVVAVTRLLPADKRGVGIGFISAAGGAGMAIGPSVGGGLGGLLGWPALFWMTLAGALLLIPGGIAVAVLSPPAGRAAARMGARGPLLAGLTVVGASTLLLSAAAGGSPVLASLGVLGVGAGFAFVITAVTDAAAGALPGDRVGAGTGVFQGAQFLGAGTGPALAGALIAARRADGADSLNPLHGADAPAFSDAFLAMAAVIALTAVVAGIGLRRTAPSPTETGSPA